MQASFRRSSHPCHVVVVLAAAILLGACNMINRVSQIGAPPQLSEIKNPIQSPEYKPVVLPMPRQQTLEHQANSLWRPGARAFFKDQRAAQIGDILTVSIELEDEAEIDNQTTRTRTNAEDSDVTNLLGYESALGRVLPQAVTPGSLVSLGSTSNSQGRGTVSRSEEISMRIAAIVSQILPNGNLVITGSQEVRVNFEKRILTVSGVIRPEDISATNTILHTQIAEARISYGGEGQLSDVQQPRYGQQLFDVIYPF